MPRKLVRLRVLLAALALAEELHKGSLEMSWCDICGMAKSKPPAEHREDCPLGRYSLIRGEDVTVGKLVAKLDHFVGEYVLPIAYILTGVGLGWFIARAPV